MKIVNKITDYIKGSISEMKKVVWPTKKQTIRYSTIVIAMSIGMAIFFGVLDYAFNIGLEAIISNNATVTEAPVETESLPAPGMEVTDVETEPVSYPTKPAE